MQVQHIFLTSTFLLIEGENDATPKPLLSPSYALGVLEAHYKHRGVFRDASDPGPCFASLFGAYEGAWVPRYHRFYDSQSQGRSK